MLTQESLRKEEPRGADSVQGLHGEGDLTKGPAPAAGTRTDTWLGARPKANVSTTPHLPLC